MVRYGDHLNQPGALYVNDAEWKLAKHKSPVHTVNLRPTLWRFADREHRGVQFIQESRSH